MAETKGKRKAKPPRKPTEIAVVRDDEKQAVLHDEADEIVPFVDEEAAADDEELAAEDALDDELADELADPEDLIGDDEPADEEAGAEAAPGARARSRGADWDAGDGGDRREDPVKTYLREIGKVPLLTKEGEVTLAKAMEIGAYAELSLAKQVGTLAAKRLKAARDLTPVERAEIDDQVHRGSEAAELLSSSSFEEKLKGELPPAKATR